MKKIISFLNTDIKIINSYFLFTIVLIILVCVGYSSYALFSFTKTSNNVIEGVVGKIEKQPNAPVLASNMIPVYYDEINDVWKKADKNNKKISATYKLGDVNEDGVIDTMDAFTIGRYLSGNVIFTQTQKLAADVDGDGKITENDSELIQQYLVGRINTFPAGTPFEEKTETVINRWYSYESSGEYKGMWANAVTVTSSSRSKYLNAKQGTAISMDDITTMWVWIPRFKAVTPSNYNGGTQEKPNAIDVTFVKQNETAIDAFTFGNKQLSGFWYGKFSISHTTLASSETENNLGCTNETCSNANGIIIKPNVTILRYNNISNFFFASRSMEQTGNSFGFISSEVDTHMSKNSEWGAVAYLTHSIYGRCSNSATCTEIGKNNNKNYITGYGASAGSSSSVTNGTYNTTLGKDASTTKNIYGIYDMSGGAWEYVMGVLVDPNGKPRSGYKVGSNSGFTGMLNDGTTYTGIAFPDSKYYNLYTGSSYTGHALTETAGWYSAYADFVKASYPWFMRGGYFNSTYAGVFNFGYGDGDSRSSGSSRLVISNE